MKRNTSRDMGNWLSELEALQPQPQPELQAQASPHGENSSEARPGPAQSEATPAGNRTKVVETVTDPIHSRDSQALTRKPPNNHKEILERADSAIDYSSDEKLIEQLLAGVYLDKKTKKYWLDKSCRNCFMLYARALSITWSDTQKYWRWSEFREDERGTLIDVVELKRVCWLEVHGRMDTKMLSPGITYEVSFLVMLKDQATGWKVPVNVRLVTPRGEKKEHKKNLTDMVKMRWIEIPVGEFDRSAEDTGDVEISMYECESGNWKHGLVIKGVVIKPKN